MRKEECCSAVHRWFWIVLGAGAYLLHLAFGRSSAFVENFYSRGLFVGFRWLWDHTLGYSPVPLLYVLLAALVVWGVLKILSRTAKKGSKRRRGESGQFASLSTDHEARPSGESLAARIGRGALLVGSRLGILVLLFYVLWGFNYDRIRFEKQFQLEVTPVDLATLKAEAERTERALGENRASIPWATDAAALNPADIPSNLEAHIRRDLVEVLSDAGYPVAGRGRVRPLWPGAWLMRFSSTGFYFPYCGEGYIAGNLTPAEKPFVIAHEMVHVYGIADEGVANLLGFLACESSADPFVRYSGRLAYWEYVFAELARASREDAKEIASRLPPGVRADLRAALENRNRYGGRLRQVAEAVYTQYLKSQGVAEGVKSYDRFVSLVVAWQRRDTR